MHSLFPVLASFIFALPLIIYSGNSASPFELPKVCFAILSVTSIFLGYLFTEFKKTHFEVRYSKTLGFGFLLVMSFLVSYFFSVNTYLSFWGDKQLPSDSLVSTVIFFIVAFLLLQATDGAEKLKRLAGVFAAVLAVQLFCGVIQVFNLDVPGWFFKYWVFGTQGQTVAYATLIGCLTPFICVFFFSSSGNKLRTAFYGTLLFLTNFIMLHTGSRTPLVVLWGTLLLITIYFFIHRLQFRSGRKSVLLLILIVASTAVFKLTNSVSEIQNKSDPALVAKGFTTRKLLLESGLIAWKERPILGFGPGNFLIAQRPHQQKEMNIYDYWEVGWTKAHNHLLDYLVNEGLVGLGAVLLLYFYLLFISLKLFFKKSVSEPELLSLACFAAFNFLFISNLTAFNMISTQLLFTIFPVLFSVGTGDVKTINIQLRPAIRALVAVGSIVCGFILVTSTYNFWRADTLVQKWTRNDKVRADKLQSLELTQKAISHDPADPSYQCFAGQLYTEMLVHNHKTLKEADKQKVLDAIAETMNHCMQLGPGLDKFVSMTADVYSELYFQSVISTPEPALNYYNKLREAIPYNPKPVLEIGRIHLQKGDSVKFVESMNEAISLKADYLPPYIELLIFYYKNGDLNGVSELANRVRQIEFRSSEFVEYIPDLITIAEENRDLHAQEVFQKVYDHYKYLIPPRDSKILSRTRNK